MVPFLNNNLSPPLQFFRCKLVLKKKKNLQGKMLILLIIEFELRGPGPPGRTCTSTTVYFYNKTKLYEENLRVDYYLR